MKYIDKNRHMELIGYLKSVAAESDQIVQSIEQGVGSVDDMPQKIRISDLIDKDGFSLVHMAVFKNKVRTFKAIMERAEQEMTP